MVFIDRKNESKRLRRALTADRSEFIVIYGRRRMGKSTLIKNVIGENDVYYEAERNEPTIQRELLCRAIAMVYPAFTGVSFSDWESLLMSFNAICNVNATLVLDEFPYLVSESKSLPSTLQRIIDSDVLRFNIIICGSSQRMMQQLVLDSSEPLYGRASERMCLGPIGVNHWAKAFGMTPEESITEFSVWGGVPRYWMLRQQYESFDDALEYLVLDQHGILANEPASLFIDDTADIAPYSSIMTAVGGGNSKFSRLADALGRKTGDLTAPLSNLTEMHYIRREVPFGEHENKTRKTLYRIDDPFMAFYYKYVAPNKSLLALGRTSRVMGDIRATLPELTSGVWENICAKAVSGNVLFEEEWGMASRWWGNVPVFNDNRKTPVGHDEIELDIVAESTDGKTLLIGECKWAHEDFADRLFRVLETKVNKLKAADIPFVRNKKIIFALFLKSQPVSHFVPDRTHNILLPAQILDLL